MRNKVTRNSAAAHEPGGHGEVAVAARLDVPYHLGEQATERDIELEFDPLADGETVGDYKWYLDIQLKLAEGGMEVIGEPHRWVVDANWKTISDNFNGDSYHTAWAHGSFVDLELGGKERDGRLGWLG